MTSPEGPTPPHSDTAEHRKNARLAGDRNEFAIHPNLRTVVLRSGLRKIHTKVCSKRLTFELIERILKVPRREKQLRARAGAVRWEALFKTARGGRLGGQKRSKGRGIAEVQIGPGRGGPERHMRRGTMRLVHKSRINNHPNLVTFLSHKEHTHLAEDFTSKRHKTLVSKLFDKLDSLRTAVGQNKIPERIHRIR